MIRLFQVLRDLCQVCPRIVFSLSLPALPLIKLYCNREYRWEVQTVLLKVHVIHTYKSSCE